MGVKEQILSEAEKLFIRFGFKKTTVAEIAQAAGIAKGSIYLHFKSKDDILIELISRRRDELLNDLEATVAKPGRPAARLTEGMLWFLQTVIDARREMKHGSFALDLDLIKRIVSVHREAQPRLRKIIERPLKFRRPRHAGALGVDEAAWLLAETEIGLLIHTAVDPDFDWRRYLTTLINSLISGD